MSETETILEVNPETEAALKIPPKVNGADHDPNNSGVLDAAIKYNKLGFAVVPSFKKRPTLFGFPSLSILGLAPKELSFTENSDVSLVLGFNRYIAVDIDAGGDAARKIVEEHLGITPLVIRGRVGRFKLIYRLKFTATGGTAPHIALKNTAQSLFNLGEKLSESFGEDDDADQEHKVAKAAFRKELKRYTEGVGAFQYFKVVSEGGGIDIEILGYGRACAAPPSRHPSVGRYTWEQEPTAELVKAIPEVTLGQIDDLRIAINPSAIIKQAATPKASAPDGVIRWYDRYRANQLQRLDRVAPGDRNRLLNEVAFYIGQLVKLGLVNRDDVEQQLTDLAVKIGLEAKEAKSTIESGLGSAEHTHIDQPLWVEGHTKGRGKAQQFIPDVQSPLNVGAFLDWKGIKLKYNQFTNKTELFGLRPYTELDDSVELLIWRAADAVGFRVKKLFLRDCLQSLALENSYHPVREYLDALEWDETPRLDAMLHTYFGAEDTEYTKAVAAKTMIAAVRRIKAPGTKFDQLPVLEGTQGTGKSTALAILALKREWFTDNFALHLKSREIMEQTEGKLIVEIPELQSMRKADIDHVKALLSRSHDKARGAYAHYATEVGRSFVMFGTVNIDRMSGTCQYLKDVTGNRRFWGVRTGVINLKALERDINQIWAEAVYRERERDSIVMPQHLWAVAESEAEERMEIDPFESGLLHHLEDLEGKILVEDVWRLLGFTTAARRTTADIKRLGHVIRKMGWEHKMLRQKDGAKDNTKGNKRRYYYVKGKAPYKDLIVNSMSDGQLDVVVMQENIGSGVTPI